MSRICTWSDKPVSECPCGGCEVERIRAAPMSFFFEMPASGEVLTATAEVRALNLNAARSILRRHSYRDAPVERWHLRGTANRYGSVARTDEDAALISRLIAGRTL